MSAMRAAGGFTLLEMLVTVAALAATAGIAFATLEAGDDRHRREETQARLSAMRLAMIGPGLESPARIAGFGADNGVLPSTLSDLLTRPEGATLFGMLAPVFDPAPDTVTGLNRPEKAESGKVSGVYLPKGWRGPYVELPPGATTMRDGWANRDADDVSDAANFGWDAQPPVAAGSPLRVSSRAADGLSDASIPANPFAADVSMVIPASHWRTDITDWPVTLSGKPSGGGNWFSLSLLVFDNAAPEGRKWRRHSTASVIEPFRAPQDAAVALPPCGQANKGAIYLDAPVVAP